MVGIDTTWKSRAVAGFASTSILATFSAPTLSLAISSSTGATILHAPHRVAQKSTSTGATLLHGPPQGGQKSTSTGVLLASTSSENESSVTATVAEVFSVIAGLQSDRSCHRLWQKHFRPASAQRRWNPNSRCRRGCG